MAETLRLIRIKLISYFYRKLENDPNVWYSFLKEESNFMDFTAIMDKVRESIGLVHNSLAWLGLIISFIVFMYILYASLYLSPKTALARTIKTGSQDHW